MNKKRLTKEVDEIAELEINWDGYGAEPFTKKIIDRAMDVIYSLEDKYVEPDIVPSNCGIQFEWEYKGNGLEIYIEDDGDSITYLKVVGEDDRNWVETEISCPGEINDLLYWLYGENNE